MTRLARAGIVLAAVALLAGCSQVAAIAPVGGDRLAEVRFAGLDVLVAAEVDILTAPVCAQAADETVTCEGEAVDGSVLTVSSPGATPDRLIVTAGDSALLDGSLQDTLENAMAG